MKHDICQVNLIHADRVSAALKQITPKEMVEEMASAYKLLGEPTRLRIMLSLMIGEMCVCDLAAALDSTPSAISQQLKLLRMTGLVQSRREGKVVYYSLAKTSVQKILLEGQNHVNKINA